jgi:hypothetical protein
VSSLNFQQMERSKILANKMKSVEAKVASQ